ncbi:ATP-grasp domain-containing protein [Neisseria gonorrhoeae]
MENRHRGGILRLSLAPAPGASEALQKKAEAYALRAMEALDYVGVLSLEFPDR